MRSRALLHKNKLDDFSDFLKSRGWTLEQPVGYEVLRAFHPSVRGPLLLHERLTGDHYTAWGLSLQLVLDYLRQKRRKH